MKRLILMIIPLLGALCTQAQSAAPEVLAGAGTHFSGTNSQLSWTAGEPVTATFTGTTTTLTQGFHQTNYAITALDEDEADPFADAPGIQIYPNPVRSDLNIRIEGTSAPLDLRLADTQGKILKDKSGLAPATLHQLDMQGIADGVYYLYFHDGQGRPIKTFKVVKSN